MRRLKFYIAAALAAAGLVHETLFCVEFLFAGRENELVATLFAYQGLVLEHSDDSSRIVMRRFDWLTWSLPPQPPAGAFAHEPFASHY